jgi:hypothetical protein
MEDRLGRRKQMRNRILRVVLIAVAGMLVAAGVAYALGTIPGADGTIHACYLKNVGTIRLVNAPGDCSRFEVAVSWNQQGQKGDPGAAGAAGAAGASAYQLALANGFSGTEAEWLASLKGADGDQGAPGATLEELSDLDGIACQIGDEEGTVTVTVASDGAVTLRCKPLPPPPYTGPRVIRLELSPAYFGVGAGSGAGTVTIDRPAPNGGVTVLIHGFLLSAVPSAVDIAEGQTSATFVVNHSAPFEPTTGSLTATLGDSSVTAHAELQGRCQIPPLNCP